MAELAVSFPFDRPSLIGVLSSAEDRQPGVPIMVLLNAGLITRTGPNRLYVRLARESAQLGMSALRFDVSGIGDSTPRTDGLPFREAAVRDVQDAFDYLVASTGISSFVLCGLCSGADLALRVAMKDKRVVGMVLLDGLPYRNSRSRFNDWILRIRRGFADGGWRRLFSSSGPVFRNLAKLGVKRTGEASPTGNDGGASIGGRDVPSLAEAEAALRQLVDRGVKILAVYTECRGYNYRQQFRDLFPNVPQGAVKVEYFEGADHTFTLLANQDGIVRMVGGWIAQFLRKSSAIGTRKT